MNAHHVRTAESPFSGWDILTESTPFHLGAEWLRLVDSAGGAEPRYSLLTRDGNPAAALVGHWNPREAHPDYRPLEALGDTGPPRLTLGGRRGYRSGLLHPPDTPAGQVTADLALLLADALEHEPRAAGAWWWPFLTTDDAALVLAAARLARPRAPAHLRLVGADCVVDPVGDGIEDFTDALPAKQRRTNFRREARRFAGSGLRMEQLRLSQVLEEAAVLHAQVQRKYGHDTSVEHLRGFLGRMADRLDDRSVVFAAFDGDALVGFTLCFAFGRELTVRLNGLDYERLPDADVYANLTVHQP
ncbi:GNAT family N-acetyltransferase, partial [Streptomyces sp. NPDC048606]|uniref:GNAT family N-acetyltransferase n=1 Tax=Streptomyces sp. NPDC048606 TaxID=3154726 RepID=UPI0034218677